MSNKTSPYLLMLELSMQGRKKLIDDVFQQSPHVYDSLYSKPNTESFNLYIELYDLIWLKSHWDSLKTYINDHRVFGIEKANLLNIFAWWYGEFLHDRSDESILLSSSIPVMENLLNLKIHNIESIIEFDERCNQNMNKVETSFKKALKLLNDDLKELISERMS